MKLLIMNLFKAGTHKSWVLRRMVTKFCTVAPNICGASVPNLLHVTLLGPIIWGWILHFSFWKICAPLLSKIPSLPPLRPEYSSQYPAVKCPHSALRGQVSNSHNIKVKTLQFWVSTFTVPKRRRSNKIGQGRVIAI
jgi:hypothetical protein